MEALALLADSTSVDVLLEATLDPVPTVVWRAAYALEKIPGLRQVPRLLELSREGPSLVRRYAVRSLGRIGATGSVDDVARLVDTATGDPALRVRIADTLGRLGELTPTAHGAMDLLLHDENFHVRVAALQAIGRAKWNELETTALHLRDDAAVDVRAALVDAATDADFRSKEALLVEALGDDAEVVVATALARLGETGTEAARARLRNALHSGATRQLRLAAASGLAAENSGATRDELEALLLDPDVFVATVAARGLGARHEGHALDALLAATTRTDDTGRDLTLAAIQALGELGERKAEKRLRALLASDEEPRVRVEARAALESILTPEEIAALPSAAQLVEDVRPHVRETGQPPVVTRSRARQLVLRTTRGRIVIDLFGEDAPQMVESFARLAARGHFDGLTFHRVVPDFVIQGGDPTGTGWGDAGYRLRSEWNRRSFGRGTVGIAHSGKDTGSCQLFITHAPQPHLDARYTIWGEVVTGMDVVDRIQRGDTFTAEVIWDDRAR
jgi:cyclophilin family peptidyl-prolyl cis-trans isomerase/HEAT repeat protein